jgi:succinate dehydrogenase / fumarate reductase iron-sulfur subunit
MKLTLRIWRQPTTDTPGKFETHEVTDAKPEMKLLELLDQVNDTLATQGKEPIAFESDCREGICGTGGITVDGRPHGPAPNTTTCGQHLRDFKDGATVRLEPFRSAAFPVIRDLVVDRSALDYAACIGCGACVAACPNGSGNLFTGAKLAHLSLLSRGREERETRARSMGAQADAEFGPCTLFGECARVCPAEIPITAVAALNHERLRAWAKRYRLPEHRKRLKPLTHGHGTE